MSQMLVKGDSAVGANTLAYSLSSAIDFRDVPTTTKDGYAITWDDSVGGFVLAEASGGGGTPGGSDTQVQYNASGAFAGDAGLTYNAANDALSVTGRVVTAAIRPASDSTTAFQVQNAAGNFSAITVDTSGKSVTLKNFLTFQGNHTGFRKGLSFVNDASGGQEWNLGEIDVVGRFNIRNVGSAGNPYVLTLTGTQRVGINERNPLARLDIAASTSTHAHIRLQSGSNPSSPNDGDLWYDGTNLKFYDGTTTHNIV